MAAAAMLQGMTAHYLTHSTYPLKPGDTCLVHAAAGGAGGLIVQMAKMLGARVFGTVSTEEKAPIAREAGADEVILYTAAGFRSRSEAAHRRPRRGRGLRFGGQDHLRQEPELAAPARHDGAVRAIERSGAAVRSEHSQCQGFAVSDPSQPGALPADARGTAVARRRRADWIDAGKLKLRIDRTYPLAEAAEAHRDLEGRQTAGKLLLIPLDMTLQTKLTLGSVLLATVIVGAGFDGGSWQRSSSSQFEATLERADVIEDRGRPR